MVLPRIFRYVKEERARLIRTARGIEPATLVIKNVNLVATTTGEILENMNIIVSDRRIASITNREPDKYVGLRTKVIDGHGQYAVPGFIDPHIHIESSLLTPTGFSMLVLRHGTTTVVADPHEIANVLGVDGVKLFIEESQGLPLKILIDIPSCVPATDPAFGLETTNKVIGPEDIALLGKLEGTYGLGEVMDFVSVTNASDYVLEKLRVAHELGLVINGHAPLLTGEILDAYIDASIWSDHESTNPEEALEKLRKGMYLFIRQGSAWRDLEALAEIIKDPKIDCRLCGFVSDDLNVIDLYEKGHMDRIINEAIQLGVDPVKAIQLATIGPAIRLHIDDHIGVIGPARFADIVLTPSLEHIETNTVISMGEIIYRDGELLYDFERPKIPEWAKKTVNIPRKILAEELLIKTDATGSVKANIIKVTPGSALTELVVEELPVKQGFVSCDPDNDILHLAVIERHKGTCNIGKGFIKGLGFKAGAIAQTIAHDTHNLVVAGKSPSDMARAVNRVREIQGGIVVVDSGEIIAEVGLPVAGLMSDEEPYTVYRKFKNLMKKMSSYGVEFEAFFMTLALVALPVIPEVRLTDRGLVDVNSARIINVLAK